MPDKLSTEQRRQAEQAKPAWQAQSEATQDARNAAIRQFVVLQTVEICKVLPTMSVGDIDRVLNALHTFLSQRS